MFASCFRCHKPEHKTENTTGSSDKHPPSIITSQTWNHSRYIKVNPIQQTITKQIFKADQPGDRRQVSNFSPDSWKKEKKNAKSLWTFSWSSPWICFIFLKRIFLSILLLKILLSSFAKPIVSAKEDEEKQWDIRSSFVFLFWILTRHENCVVSSFVAAVLDFKWQLLK